MLGANQIVGAYSSSDVSMLMRGLDMRQFGLCPNALAIFGSRRSNAY